MVPTLKNTNINFIFYSYFLPTCPCELEDILNFFLQNTHILFDVTKKTSKVSHDSNPPKPANPITENKD